MIVNILACLQKLTLVGEQAQHAAVAAALVIGDGVAEFIVRKTEAARVQLMSVSDDVIEKARTLLLHL